MKRTFLPGIDVLLQKHAAWLRGRRIGLVAHPASVDADGVPSGERLRAAGFDLVCLFGPEHGYFGKGGAGENVTAQRHPQWRIPIHSLYGKTRRPTAEMLKGLDVIIYDLQDLGCRPYTYVSTLRCILEAAAERGKEVIVADRPVPLANTVDGPMRVDRFESFVGLVPAPVVYGMTPGETARWLKQYLEIAVGLRVARMQGYRRDARRGSKWPDWIPPSPAIQSWESGMCFPCTVFLEALPALDHGRRTDMPFQVVGAPWLNSEGLCDILRARKLPGVVFAPLKYGAGAGNYLGQRIPGVRMHVNDPKAFRPVATSVSILHALQCAHGRNKIWEQPGTREDFFDQLMGTDAVRKALRAGQEPAHLIAAWEKETSVFRTARSACLFYSPLA